MYSSIKNKSYLSPNYTHLAMSQQPNEINDINDINDNINDHGDNRDENHRPNLEDFVMVFQDMVFLILICLLY
jgi:hypothetical protein